MSNPNSFPEAGHNHGACVELSMEAAEAICRSRSGRLTDLRRRVLEIVLDSHRPIGAYAILEALQEDGRRPAPPTVYRSLEFLLDMGLVHRIASLNAFVGCTQPGHRAASQFLICEECGDAAELNDPAVEDALLKSAESLGFRPQGHTVEIRGVCPNCG
ncbi:MAG: Fur family transcriptional regulator [Pseudomonadota bacterium]